MSSFREQFEQMHRMARGEDTTAGAVRQMEGKGMTRERLEKLRARVFTDYQQWDVKCSKDGFQEATPTGKMDSDGNDLLALIDAEIARQSVTDDADDEEIQKAINHHEYRVGKRQEDIKVYRESKNPELMRSADMFERALCRDRIILAALRQYQKPTDEAPTVGDMHDYALRQMRTEPCQCTEICGICNNPNYHIHSSIWWKSASTEYGRENREIPTRHCPNCGRLVKHDG